MSDSAEALSDRLARLGTDLGAREREHAADLEQARDVALGLHGAVASALDAFHGAAGQAGAPHLRVEIGEPRTDDKHLRSVQFELRRGRHCAIVTVKSRGEVTLVGPFRAGKTEGPCKSFPLGAQAEIDVALGSFLERFLEEAATP